MILSLHRFAWPLIAMGVTAASMTPPPLYTYQRTNSEITQITIGAAPPDGPVISPRLFSNFLEHLGGTVYEGLWANVVYNPQFEADKQGRLVRWSLKAGAKWSRQGLAGRGLQLSEGSFASQPVYLPVHRQRAYRGGLWTMGKGLLTVALYRGAEGAPLVRQTLRVESTDWKRLPIALTVPEDSLKRAEAAELRLTADKGDLSLDMVEVFPSDHLDGVDPDVLERTKDLRIELLRWPGGNFVSGYHWREGVGPREKRPTIPNPAWGGLETHHFGTDEFLRFCRRIGAKPQISINAGNGTPEDAAAWVQYCNGSADTPMGRLRAANGHPKPYNVRVWEVGNELYGDWQIGHTDPAGNAARYMAFVHAMRKADPTIEIIATGKGDEYTGKGLKACDAWNEALLAAIRVDREQGGRIPEYLSLHPLVPLPGELGKHYSYEQIYDSVMAHPQWWSDTYVPRLKNQIESALSKEAKMQAAPTEWGIIVGGPEWLKYPNHDTQSGAVYAALYFHAMLRRADFVGLANVTALMHGGGIKRPNSVVYVDPMYYVERLYGTARPKRLLSTTVRGPGYDVPERGILPAVEGVPFLDVIAAQGPEGPMLFVINRDAGKARQAEIHFPAPVKDLRCETLSAAPQQGNSLEHPDTVHPRPSILRVNGTSCTATFFPCSVTILRWSEKKSR